ncbi:MAG: hypothetical protein JNM56_29815 [Planctomycetia bacterium]|nr:hypothetical protein [Planctomycetia bacterium]
MSPGLADKVVEQIGKAGLPISGSTPFVPRLTKNRRGDYVIVKQAVSIGPKKGKKGFLDSQGRIWLRDRAHADVPDHRDVQLRGGEEYFRVDMNGNELR